MARIFSSQQIYVSCSEVESFSMTLVEAMSQGCLCVSLANSGPRSIICDGKDGFLVRRGDWNALVDKICCMVEMSRSQMRSISENARVTASKYRTDNVVTKWSVLLEAISGVPAE